MEPVTLQGRKWGSVGGLVLTATVAVLLITLLVFHLSEDKVGLASLVAAAAAPMLLHAFNSALLLARPNRLILTDEGITFKTPYRSRSWSWDQYAGLHGWWARVLIVHRKLGTTRRVSIGHWQPDLGRSIADFARRVGHTVPPGTEEETPSAMPLFMISGLLLAATLAVALFR